MAKINRDAVFTIRLKQEEKDAIMNAAAAVGMDGANFARLLLLSTANQINTAGLQDLPDMLRSTGRIIANMGKDT